MATIPLPVTNSKIAPISLPAKTGQEINGVASVLGLSYTQNNGGAPVLGNPSNPFIYKVHSDYRWTLNTNKEVRGFVPRVTLTEYKLTQSGQLGSLKLQLMATTESSLGVQVGLIPASNYIGQKAGDITNAALSRTKYGAFAPLAGRLVGTAVGVAADVGLAKAIQEGASTITHLEYLQPYYNLYPSKPTGLIYELPYLNIDNMTSINSTWKNADTDKTMQNIKQLGGQGLSEAISSGLGGGKKGGKAAGQFAEFIKGSIGAAQAVSQLEFALGSPGQGVEKIKVFTPTDDGDEINITFYLFNTEDINDIRNNWNFLWSLTYQNLPNRRSINLLDPPCVYEVDVPGYKRFPIAAMTSLKVTNEGTTRLINMNTGDMVTIVDDNVKMIPEAYKVTMTLRSLLSNTRNLFYNSYNNSSKINVNGQSTGNY